MSSYTTSDSTTFTLTHAKEISSKVAADLKRIQRLHNGTPSDSEIANYEGELIELLKGGYLKEVIYGFQRQVGDTKEWLQPTLIYTAKDLSGSFWDNDDPGKILPGGDLRGTYFNSHLTYSDAWLRLTEAQKSAVTSRLPVQRTTQPKPSINGYLVNDRSYSAGGKALDRSSVRSL